MASDKVATFDMSEIILECASFEMLQKNKYTALGAWWRKGKAEVEIKTYSAHDASFTRAVTPGISRLAHLVHTAVVLSNSTVRTEG